MEQSGLPLGKALTEDRTGKKRWRASSGTDRGLFGQRPGGQGSWVPLVASNSGSPPKHRGFLTPCMELMDPNRVFCPCYCSAAWKRDHRQH